MKCPECGEKLEVPIDYYHAPSIGCPKGCIKHHGFYDLVDIIDKLEEKVDDLRDEIQGMHEDAAGASI